MRKEHLTKLTQVHLHVNSIDSILMFLQRLATGSPSRLCYREWETVSLHPLAEHVFCMKSCGIDFVERIITKANGFALL